MSLALTARQMFNITAWTLSTVSKGTRGPSLDSADSESLKCPLASVAPAIAGKLRLHSLLDSPRIIGPSVMAHAVSIHLEVSYPTNVTAQPDALAILLSSLSSSQRRLRLFQPWRSARQNKLRPLPND